MSSKRTAIASRQIAALLMSGAAFSTLAAPVLAQSADPDEIVVRGRAEFFRPTENTSATKIPLPIVETPQSITVLTDDILDLTASTDLEDTIGLVPGFVNIGSYAGIDNRFQARGFDISVAEGILLNGVSIATNVDRDLLGVERIEFLRGPTSIVLGTLNYGGAVNIITRRPSAEFEQDYLIRVGSFDTSRVQAEVSGPLNPSGTIRGYLGVAYEDREGFRDGEELNKLPIKAAFDFDIGPNTLLTIDASYE
ncbi:MAG: TonB-dependent receptor plug domain-containing protein, partial [Pseudomonadota bacterium]